MTRTIKGEIVQDLNYALAATDTINTLSDVVYEANDINKHNWLMYEVYKHDLEAKLASLQETQDKTIKLINHNKEKTDTQINNVYKDTNRSMIYLRKDVDKLKKELNVTYKIIGIIVVLDLILDVLRLL